MAKQDSNPTHKEDGIVPDQPSKNSYEQAAERSQSMQAVRIQAMHTGTYRAAFVGTASPIPLVATLASAAIYFALPEPLYSRPFFAIVGGIVLALMIWTTIAQFYRPYTSVDKADVFSYNLLLDHLVKSSMVLDAYDGAISGNPGNDIHSILYINTANTYFLAATNELQTPITTWRSGFGYLSVSRLVHRLEEALILLMPVDQLLIDFAADEVNLNNSLISNKEYYGRVLRTALEGLNQIQERMLASVTTVGKASSEQSHRDEGVGALGIIDEYRSRIMLREVRAALNRFQDDQWEKLVHVRNYLTQLTILTGLVLFILLVFAILSAVPISILIASTLYFLIGAVVGLFSRLYEQSKADTSIENVRLAGARLMARPLFSGLAALGGVLLAQKVAASGNTSPFDTINAFNILAATAFGLTPNLFFNAIQNQTDANKTNVKSTSSSV